MLYIDAYMKTESCKLCIFNPYSFRVIYPWNLPSFFERCLLFNTFNSFNVKCQYGKFSDHLPDRCPINKYFIKVEFLLRDIKLWNFIFDRGLFQTSGEKRCLFSTLIWQDTKMCMLSTTLGLHEGMSHRSVLALVDQDIF